MTQLQLASGVNSISITPVTPISATGGVHCKWSAYIDTPPTAGMQAAVVARFLWHYLCKSTWYKGHGWPFKYIFGKCAFSHICHALR